MCVVFFFKQKTAYEMRISDWSSDVCSSDLKRQDIGRDQQAERRQGVRKPAPAEQLAFSHDYDRPCEPSRPCGRTTRTSVITANSIACDRLGSNIAVMLRISPAISPPSTAPGKDPTPQIGRAHV